MNLYHSEKYTIELPEKHRFPMDKYKLVRRSLIDQEIFLEAQIKEATLATKKDILLAHSLNYIDSIKSGDVDQKDFKRIGFPWSEMLYLRSLSSVGGFLDAVEDAILSGISGNLSGGTHHAHYDRGEGFCVFNDFAIGARKLNKLNKRVLIIDLDVHQGNGNSSILSGDKDTFVFSMHGEKNYPFKKIESNLDVALKNNTSDDEYLSTLSASLRKLPKMDVMFYQAGVDILISDKLGTLDISMQGIYERDKLVFDYAKACSVPIVIVMGGGYSNPIDDTVCAHVQTFKLASDFF